MLRTMAALIGLVSFATLLAEGIAVGILAARGQLSSESVTAIGAALTGEMPQAVATAAAAAPPQAPPVPPSAEEVETARTLKTLELNARADELRLLKGLLTAEAERLRLDRDAYDQSRKAFEQRIADLGARNADEATEQTRAVVKAMQSKEAVRYLISIPEPDAVRVLKGLPERTVAKILQEFAAGTDEEQQRGRAIFTAISDGMPDAEALAAARDALSRPASGGPAP